MPPGTTTTTLLINLFNTASTTLTAVTLGLAATTLTLVHDVYSNTTTSSLTQHSILEVTWTVVPCVFILIGVTHGLSSLYALDSMVGTGNTAHLVGNQWYWTTADSYGSTHDSRMLPSNTLLPGALRLGLTDQPLYVQDSFSLLVSSNDVLHCISIPTLGLKVDAIPGRVNMITVSGVCPGTYSGYCNELCGAGHGFMPLSLVSTSTTVSSHLV